MWKWLMRRMVPKHPIIAIEDYLDAIRALREEVAKLEEELERRRRLFERQNAPLYFEIGRKKEELRLTLGMLNQTSRQIYSSIAVYLSMDEK